MKMNELRPEERMAERFSKLQGLLPPVDVFSVAKSIAQTSTVTFPDWASSDGLTLDLKVPGKRPRIYINSRIGYHRQRFTAAHEIGHIIIPWHIGDIVDDLSIDDSRDNSRYRRLEGEANRFASELLMPRRWAAALCNNVEHLRGAIITIAEVADVSLSAAALRALQLGPSGYVIAHCRDGEITMIGQTPGTRASLPEKGARLDSLKLSAFHDPELFGGGNATVYVWKERVSLVAPDSPPNDWRSILGKMLEIIPVERRVRALTQINAIVGYRLGKHPRGTTEDLMYKDVVKAFEHRTDGNVDVQQLRKHPDFEAYVLARIYERSAAKPG
jgi:IrrE N-terminal-like domain